ncbi:hypothetical protein MMA231_00944 [Asticcacaulis sp. MM231]|uniref:hypothetical protein n=1 Tax=Asticcacaulis sp. MM231 TaxID=3157666 RepID=UPI0032D5743E
MSQIRHTSSLEAVLRIMRRTRESADHHHETTLSIVHLDTWISMLGAVHADLAERELAVVRAEAGLKSPATRDGDRLDAAYAENMLRNGMSAIERLALQAMKHPDATPQDRCAMKMDAAVILDALEHLTLGVVRPEFNPETDTGA